MEDLGWKGNRSLDFKSTNPSSTFSSAISYSLPDIAAAILTVRGHKVILDADLARIYGVPTKRLNEQVKRNPNRFPPDFAFLLTSGEKNEVVANCDHLRRLKFSPVLPHAFTEHGAIMAANVLNDILDLCNQQSANRPIPLIPSAISPPPPACAPQ